MKCLIYGLALCLVVPALAETNAPAATAKKPRKSLRLTPEQWAERKQQSMMKRFGGTVRKEGSAFGKVVFLNAQKTVAAKDLKRTLDYIDDEIHPLWELKEVDSVKLTNPSADIAKAGGKVGVVIGESADLPALTVAPEEGWAVVNVAPLKDGAEGEKLAHRVRVELMRAFALASGAAFASRDPIVMVPGIRTASDLDPLQEFSYGVDVRFAVSRNLPGFGVTPWNQKTYKQACEEGWAPNPTNDVQKKIWDKVHQLPTNPLPLEKPAK